MVKDKVARGDQRFVTACAGTPKCVRRTRGLTKCQKQGECRGVKWLDRIHGEQQKWRLGLTRRAKKIVEEYHRGRSA